MAQMAYDYDSEVFWTMKYIKNSSDYPKIGLSIENNWIDEHEHFERLRIV